MKQCVLVCCQPSAKQPLSNSKPDSKSSRASRFFYLLFPIFSSTTYHPFYPQLPFLTPCFRNGKAKIGIIFELPNDQEKYFVFLFANRLLLRNGMANIRGVFRVTNSCPKKSR